ICLTVATLSAWARGQVAQESAADHVVRGAVTEPSKRLKLQFDTIGVIKDVLVEPGDRVQSGQVLAAQDDYVEQKSLEALLVEASSQYSVEAQKADEAIKKVVLERKRKMYASNVSSNSEV
ncbi:MAG: hypothetical protein ACREIT_06985, partial [Tepidisphaeraceae bacterium]